MASSTKKEKNGDVLSKAARDYGRKVAADPKLAAEFLKVVLLACSRSSHGKLVSSVWAARRDLPRRESLTHEQPR